MVDWRGWLAECTTEIKRRNVDGTLILPHAFQCSQSRVTPECSVRIRELKHPQSQVCNTDYASRGARIYKEAPSEEVSRHS